MAYLKDESKLCSFLGEIGYYYKFIKDFVQLANPLFNLLKKNFKFEWTTEADLAFKILKERLIQAPISIPPYFNKAFIIRTDVSNSWIREVIMQKDKNVIHYISLNVTFLEIT